MRGPAVWALKASIIACAPARTWPSSPSALRRQPDWRYLLREKIALIAYSLLGVQGSAHKDRAGES